MFGGYLADNVLGRFKTVLYSIFFYSAGVISVCASSYPGYEIPSLFFIGLYFLIPIGISGIRSNICTFGADQYDLGNENEKQQQSQFFGLFYWAVNLGV